MVTLVKGVREREETGKENVMRTWRQKKDKVRRQRRTLQSMEAKGTPSKNKGDNQATRESGF